MDVDASQVDRVEGIRPLPARAVSGHILVYRGSYRRRVPPHYLENPYIREIIEINLILVPEGRLIVPARPQSNFRSFFEELRQANPELFRRILSPTGTAKTASTDHITPIKEIIRMRLAGMSLPGDDRLYGWNELEEEARRAGIKLQLLFQGNGLYFNRGSVFYEGERLLAAPDASLADLLESGLSPGQQNRLAITEEDLKRPLLFFLVEANGRMAPYYHRFDQVESYRQGMERLAESLRHRGVRAALAASPPLVIPDDLNEPVYLSLEEILSVYHANDARHTLYCPYQGAVLLSAELGRAHCLQPESLAASLSGKAQDRLRLRLSETLNFVSAEELSDLLQRKGYSGRYSLESQEDPVSKQKEYTLSINPLEGVYSHLAPFLTRQGQFGILQTSGTRGNITGNDGPTIRQLTAILRDLNSQPPFDRDPIVAAASGSQGNDVPNVMCKGKDGEAGLLYTLAPESGLDVHPVLRGTVTTPRVGIGV